MDSKILLMTTIGAFFDLFSKIACDNSDLGHVKPLSKRQGAYQICTESFEIYVDRIIRTHDSQNLGAKYITEREVLTRDDCLKLCCETEGCDVFVFEEKHPGSCFMFECGTGEDFKCQFTSHQNYTSAVLSVSRHMSELETQIKFTQHEHELNKLRIPEKQEPAAINVKTTLPTLGNKETLEVIPKTEKEQSRCNIRIQFECHTSHECIAIYNVCDGIPQCQDRSDEGPELGCPSQVPINKPVITTTQAPIIEQEMKADYGQEKNNYRVQPPPQGFQPPNYDKNSQEAGFRQNYPNSNQLALESARAAYGREGEGLAYNRGYQPQTPYRQNQVSGGSQIFNHKGGLIQNDQYPQRNYQENIINPLGTFSEQQIPNYYGKYNNYYDPQNQIAPQNVQFNKYPYNGDILPADESSVMAKNNKYTEKGVPAQDYYGESYQGRNSLQLPLQPAFDYKAHAELNSLKKEKQVLPAQQELQRISTVATTAMIPTKRVTTKKSKVHRKIDKGNQWSLIKFEKVTSDSKFTIIDGDEHPSAPSGAILSLTLGLLMTAIMVTLIGCRIRTVRRRFRRGGKGGYAHDADFLVNGMYL